MGVILSDLAKNDDWIRRLNNRQFDNLSVEQTRWVLSHMGEVMSLRKVNRKVALMATVLMKMKVGEEINADEICHRSMYFIQNRERLNVKQVGLLLKLIVKWGFLERYRPTAKSGNYLYRRIK